MLQVKKYPVKAMDKCYDGNGGKYEAILFSVSPSSLKVRPLRDAIKTVNIEKLALHVDM
jgi:hypothetical protein